MYMVKEKVDRGLMTVTYVSIQDQCADSLTKFLRSGQDQKKAIAHLSLLDLEQWLPRRELQQRPGGEQQFSQKVSSSSFRMYQLDKDCIFRIFAHPKGTKSRDVNVKDLSVKSYKSLLEKFHSDLSVDAYPEVTPVEAMAICLKADGALMKDVSSDLTLNEDDGEYLGINDIVTSLNDQTDRVLITPSLDDEGDLNDELNEVTLARWVRVNVKQTFRRRNLDRQRQYYRNHRQPKLSGSYVKEEITPCEAMPDTPIIAVSLKWDISRHGQLRILLSLWKP